MIYKIVACFLFFIGSWSLSHAAAPEDAAPECSAVDINNKTLNMKDYRNKVVYLDFWASWCPPCKKSFPLLNRLHSELKDKGFEVVAINLDESQSDASEFLAGNRVSFSIFYDEKGECPSTYQVTAMPSSYVINKQGIVKKVYLGFHDENEAEIRATLLALLNE